LLHGHEKGLNDLLLGDVGDLLAKSGRIFLSVGANSIVGTGTTGFLMGTLDNLKS